jgi:hypothetical protein
MEAKTVARVIQSATIAAGGAYLWFVRNHEVRLFLVGCLSVDAIVLGTLFLPAGRFHSPTNRTHRVVVLFALFLAILVAGAVAADRRAFIEPVTDY